jgi:N12 class adenine-specific DNA methylase
MPRHTQLSLEFDALDRASTQPSHADPPPSGGPQAPAPMHRLPPRDCSGPEIALRNEFGDLPLFRFATSRALEAVASPEAPDFLPPGPSAAGERAKARDILAAIRILNQLDAGNRPATLDERRALARFGGFGAVALTLFPDPVRGTYKDGGWRELGEELQGLLSPADYESAKRTTFNAFYTAPVVMAAMHRTLDGFGVPEDALMLEPGCGIGNFMGHARNGRCFIGVELDRTSGRIARALYPQHDIRIEDFRDTRLPEGRIDAVIGNVPFANITFDHRGQRFSLHDYFIAKATDALRPEGVLALVTSRFTLDKQNASIREYLSDQADFLGAIRLPSDAFKREGTAVVTDILVLRKRAAGAPARHADEAWLETAPLAIEGAEVSINRYFLNHRAMVLGAFCRERQLYGADGYGIRSAGDLAEQLDAAIRCLPGCEPDRQPAIDKERVPPRLARPPPRSHVAEGSFFVREDGVICRLLGGEAAPVTHGRTVLRSGGTKMGKRLAALIALRDEARRVLQSQNEGWSNSEREATRRSLNGAYDRFVAAYGPINRTTFGQTRDGHSIRRMPNLVVFREDPDAMLVMSLEDYDEVSGQATKAAILRQDVVGRTSTISSVQTAEEGLLVSLDRRGGVDLPFIAGLYGRPDEQVVAELGDLIYRNPETHCWETADVYLSGNVRAKLAAAIAAGPEFARNAEVLAGVQPPDLLPGDIDANLGAPWIPAGDIQAFAAELLGVPPASVTIAHLKKDAVWSVDGDAAAEQSVAATSAYGTERANALWLLELALNMKTPVIYDTIHVGGREERVVNQEATLAAKEKQKLIKDRFRATVFENPDRTERLVRIYNDTYNNLRPRLFDGSHLEFPGMNCTIELRPHQKDAVWRGMSSGNTLLAHAVGAGKTFVMAAAGMKLREAGLVKKPMYVVPNHMLEQFAREFLQLFPNANLLVATKEDLTRSRRKHLTAKIASGAWDGIIVTHSSFERIGMSRAYQERFLRQQIAEYERLLCEAAGADASRPHRNMIKMIEKQKAAREARLTELLAQDKKDDGLVFDELGVDHLFVDEAQYFKNLETPTKMQRVAGIQTGGSQRAMDLYMKARYLDELHAGHGVTFASGTPISNTMVEMYTVQRFLDPQGLVDRGIEHFDAWAATFGEVVETMEISPDGSTLKPRSRFARFCNLPELQQMFRAFSDVQTAEMLDLPRPALDGGKPFVIACPMSAEQGKLQQGLVERYERLRSQKVDPREDNALTITTDGRKLALDARLLSAAAPDNPDSKVNAAVENIERIWQQTSPSRGTQIVFCDMGVRPTPWGYSVYEDVVAKLIARGIPREQIAAIGDADSDAKKQSLFDRVRSGSVRVLIGSTQKMGTGTNVQKRLVALHHLDAPWKPAEVEQREGRILRQGNDNEAVAIYRYVTEGSFDAFMWQALETKARFIAQVMTGDSAVRRADDIASQELSYAEVKAIASGNPAVLTLAEADAELKRLMVLKRNHADEQFLARRKLRELPEMIERLRQRMQDLLRDQATLTAHADDPVSIDGRACLSDEVLSRLGKRLDSAPAQVSQTTRSLMGQFRGLMFGLVQYANFRPEVFLEGTIARTASLSRDQFGPRAMLNALERLAGGYAQEYEAAERNLALAEGQLRDYDERRGKPFDHEAYLTELDRVRDALRDVLSGRRQERQEGDEQAQPTAGDLVDRIKQLRSAHTIDADARRPSHERASTAEEPITARVRRRIECIVQRAPPDTDGHSRRFVQPAIAPTELA